MVASVAVIMDYQNMHLTGHDRFTPPGIPKHESLIHPLLFADEVIKPWLHSAWRRNPIYPLVPS